MHKYDYEFWKTIDEMTWRQLKKCAKQVIYTLMGLLITLAMQPIRLYEYVRYRLESLKETRIEREENERFKNLMETGHI